MKLKSKAKTGHGNYPDIDVGDQVRLPIVHKTHKGYKEHTFQKDYHNGVCKVDNQLYQRKELQVVIVDLVKLPEKSKQEQAVIKSGKQLINLLST